VAPLDDSNIAVESLSTGPHHVIIHIRYPFISHDDAPSEYLTIGWGASRHGQLGLESKTSIFSVPRLIYAENTTYDDRIVSSSLGSQHSIFLHASCRISCLGSNKKGQLLDLNTLGNVRSVYCTWNGTYAVVQNGDNDHTHICATGSHIKGQLGRVISTPESEQAPLALASVYFPFSSSSHRLKSVASGSEHLLSLFVVTSDDPGIATENEMEVWGWGWNEHGNLGIGTTDDIRLPSRIWPGTTGEGDRAGRAVGIWAGCGTSWIALELQD